MRTESESGLVDGFPNMNISPSLILRRSRSFAVPFASLPLPREEKREGSERDRELPRTSENQATFLQVETPTLFSRLFSSHVLLAGYYPVLTDACILRC